VREATNPEQRRLLTQIQILMQGGSGASVLLGDMTVEEEQRLISALFAVSKLDATVPLLCVLAGARSHSPSAREAQTIGMIRLAKQRFDRGDWLGCEKWLSPLAKARPSASVRNLLGCCLCLGHDFAGGILHFQEALRLAGDDPRIHQNLALAFSWQGDLPDSDLCWGRYLGTYNKRIPRPPGFIDYHEQLRFQVLRHLGNQHYERENWAESRGYLQEAHELRPDDFDLAERLFLLQVQAGNRAAARTVLTHLQQLRPKHPPFELYELDLIEVRTAADLERLLDTVARVVERLIEDPTSQEKVVSRVWPQLQVRADQLTRTLREIREDLHRLYEDSPGWYDALRDLRAVKKDLRRLRQILRYCASLRVNDPTRRKLDSLCEDLDRKIDYCRRWEEID
jgi:Flp pilus assembly protein TadD